MLSFEDFVNQNLSFYDVLELPASESPIGKPTISIRLVRVDPESRKKQKTLWELMQEPRPTEFLQILLGHEDAAHLAREILERTERHRFGPLGALAQEGPQSFCWSNAQLTGDATSLDDMIEDLEEAAAKLRELRDAGFVLDPESAVEDDMAFLIAPNKEAMLKFTTPRRTQMFRVPKLMPDPDESKPW